jgi:hypothetical protein
MSYFISARYRNGKEKSYGPYFHIVPVQDRHDSDKIRPTSVCSLEKIEVPSVWICPSRSDEYRLDLRLLFEIDLECLSHWQCILYDV